MSDHVTVQVLYFAALKDLTKVSSEKMNVPKSLQVKDFLPYLVKNQASLASERGKAILSTCACAVNLEYVDLDNDTTTFKDGSEVALISPVSGG